MELELKAPRGQDNRERVRTLTLTGENEHDYVKLAAFGRLLTSSKELAQLVADEIKRGPGGTPPEIETKNQPALETKPNG